MNVAKNPITKIPPALNKNESNKKNLLLVFDKPSIAIPSSSGNGEAIIRAPKNGAKKWKSFVLKI